MKKLSFVLLLVVAMVFVSCKEEGGDALGMIPGDADFVAAVDAGSLIKKADIKIDNGQVVFPESYSSLTSGLSAKDMEDLSRVAESGIDFTKKMYFFGTNDFEVVGIIPTNDKEAFKAFLEKENEETMETDGDLYKMNEGSMIVFISDNNIVFGQPKYSVENATAEAYIKGIIANGSQPSIKENADAMEMLDRDVDMAMFGDYKRMMELSGEKIDVMAYGKALGEYIDAIRGIGFTLNFGKKDVEMGYEAFYDENNAMVKQCLAVMGTPSAEGLRFIPADIQLVFSGSAKGEEILKIEAFKTALGNIEPNAFITNEEIKDYIAGIDGPITIGWNYVDYLANRYSMPQVYGAIKTDKADEMCQKLQSTINGFGFIACQKVGDEYVLNASAYDAIAFGSKDGFFYFRTTNRPVKESLYDDDLARGIFESTPGGCYVNLLKGSRANSMLTSMAPNLDFSGYVEGKTIDDNSASVKLVVEEPESANVLETLLMIAAQNVR